MVGLSFDSIYSTPMSIVWSLFLATSNIPAAHFPPIGPYPSLAKGLGWGFLA